MKAIKDIRRKIAQKEEEAKRLREQLLKAEAYLEAMQESLKLIERTAGANGGSGLRPNSMVDKARKALQQAGRPMHVAELLGAIGKEVTKNNRTSLSGSLGFYVRQEEIFTRPAPNTFGLKEFEGVESEEQLPEGFGQ